MVTLRHEVIAREIEDEDINAVTARKRPGRRVRREFKHVLEPIDKIVRDVAPIDAALDARHRLYAADMPAGRKRRAS